MPPLHTDLTASGTRAARTAHLSLRSLLLVILALLVAIAPPASKDGNTLNSFFETRPSGPREARPDDKLRRLRMRRVILLAP